MGEYGVSDHTFHRPTAHSSDDVVSITQVDFTSQIDVLRYPFETESTGEPSLEQEKNLFYEICHTIVLCPVTYKHGDFNCLEFKSQVMHFYGQ
jgi:hypothetical protein